MSDKKVWTIRDKVEYFLEKSERCRNDDKYLTVMYWRFADKLDMNNLAEEYIEKGTPATSIVRARCLIQSKGLYPPRPEVAKRRGLKEKAFRHNISNYSEVPEDNDISAYDVYEEDDFDDRY